MVVEDVFEATQVTRRSASQVKDKTAAERSGIIAVSCINFILTP
jgi:hypothetical protein